MSSLFSPLALRELTLPNRIVIAPMCQYSAVDGSVGDWHLIYLDPEGPGEYENALARPHVRDEGDGVCENGGRGLS